MSQSGWICSLTISNAENLWGFLFCTFSPRCLPKSFGIISFCSSLLFVRIGIIHPNIRREKRLFGRKDGGNQSPVKIVWLHICPFHSALLKVGLVGCDGLGLCSTEHLSLPAEPGLPSELNRKMTKWWQRNGSQFQVELPPLRTHGIVFSDGASTTSSRSLQRLMIWRLESCPNAQGIQWFLEWQSFMLEKNFEGKRPSWKLRDWFWRDKTFLKFQEFPGFRVSGEGTTLDWFQKT